MCNWFQFWSRITAGERYRFLISAPKMTELTEPEVKLEALLGIINSSARQAIAEYKKTGHGVPSADATTFHPLDMATDTLALRKATRLLEGAYHQLSAILAPPQHTVMNFVFDYNWACTNVALRARFADVLEQHPEGLSVDKLAEAANLDKSKTARVLRALSLMGCFKEVERDVFTNTRLSLILKSTNNTGCYAHFHSRDVSKYAGVLYETMIDQEFSRSHEERGYRRRAFWDMMKKDDERRDIFHRGMLGYSEMTGTSTFLHQYHWDNVCSVVDVGSGIGAFSMPLAKMFPHLRITNHDLPEIIVQAQNAWEKDAPDALLDGRVEFVPNNFLEDIPAAGKDVYYLRHILHDWPDAEATMILRNIRKAMGPNSVLLIRTTEGLSIDPQAPEPMLPNFGAGSHGVYQIDLTMWFLLNSKERTLDELKIIAQVPYNSSLTRRATAGLALTQVYDLVETMVMEFRIA
ncbi:S-adenosyl-L-methionine-dependent methyltransferase [Suillus subalutaceus]|uniref:S-adenosyl-L-methionine-dependent methyltransferase n=1 Tax=Suillus subalutaceus TaxID=48586 RepID=UPI001B886844|nr:S-adenosyl-L-methionine-dependent methyltransferase [Suillus subalutaceus]KAG1860309.1 S-adenosyl-L-methionine-dependent methyltransferase [Suillus subalutaceus]